MRFGELIRSERVRAGMLQREIADELGIHASYLSDVEHCVRPPMSVRLTARFCDVVNSDPETRIIMMRLNLAERGRMILVVPQSESRRRLCAILMLRWSTLSDHEADAVVEMLR